jgi:tRNA A-37 threonylcarbamoyl transferase component Bud32
MQGSNPLITANAIEDPGRILESFLSDRAVSGWLHETHVDWSKGRLLNAPDRVIDVLKRVQGLEDDSRTLTPSGMRILGRLQIDLESATRTSVLAEHFEIEAAIAKGSSSIALKAVNRRVGRTVVLKILQPVLPEVAEAAIGRLGSLEGIPHLVAPIDSEVVETTTVAGDPVRLYCIVFPLIRAITLEDYLRHRPPITPFFFETFLRQIGGVLEKLEERQMSHGDLHGRNILVSSEDPSLEFTVIDPSPGLSTGSPYSRARSDFEWLQRHLAEALMVLQRHLPSISMQKHLGPRLFSIVNTILRAKTMHFREVLRLLEESPRYKQWQHDRSEFITSKFRRPKPLGLLRWEEIADPAQALELFEPYPELFRRVRGFGNSLVVGARGSGKSTYLAALAYFPGAKKRLVEPSEIFGVLFSCRQGEFKQISSEFIHFDAISRLTVKHVLVLKIIRRVLTALASAGEFGELASSSDLSRLYDFVRSHLGEQVSIARVRANFAGELSNLASTVVRWEELEMRRLFAGSEALRDVGLARLNETSLLQFCELVREAFPTLVNSQFYFLFDDAGEPNIPRDAQHVLNDLVTSSNAVYCVKLSAERYSYELRDSVGRTLEETHDFTSFDISSAYATEGGLDQSRAAIKAYFSQIVTKRLVYWNYSATDIAAYLGDQMKSGNEMIPIRELVRRLAEGKKTAFYAGWDVVWQLADKTPRNLIELVSEIFAYAGVRPEGREKAGRLVRVGVISANVQDRAVRAVSSRRLRGLEFIPGEITIRGEKVPLGKHLYLCTTSFGTVSHRYLTASRGESRRLDERLAIERNDTGSLNPEAGQILQMLVRYGIFDDSALNVAFDDGQKKPIYVFNRIFCPAFSISFRRDAHLRLSARKFEMYLLQPAGFVERGTAFLRGEAPRRGEKTLWEDDSSES